MPDGAAHTVEEVELSGVSALTLRVLKTLPDFSKIACSSKVGVKEMLELLVKIGADVNGTAADVAMRAPLCTATVSSRTDIWLM